MIAADPRGTWGEVLGPALVLLLIGLAAYGYGRWDRWNLPEERQKRADARLARQIEAEKRRRPVTAPRFERDPSPKPRSNRIPRKPRKP